MTIQDIRQATSDLHLLLQILQTMHASHFIRLKVESILFSRVGNPEADLKAAWAAYGRQITTANGIPVGLFA